jgi:hypothetical protein
MEARYLGMFATLFQHLVNSIKPSGDGIPGSNRIPSAHILLILFFLAGCSPAKVASQPSSPILFSTQTAVSPTWVDPNGHAEAAQTPTVEPVKTNSLYCQQLTQSYHPEDGFQTFCDPDYLFAFEFPTGWKITLIATSPDTETSSPLWIRRGQMFAAADMSNLIRVDTYRLNDPMALTERVQNYFSFAQREFANKDYPSLKIGGKRAYAILNRWQQDISGVTLFFQHGKYYSAVELKAPSSQALETNWKIVRTLQVPWAAPSENVIPDDLIADSHHLLP